MAIHINQYELEKKYFEHVAPYLEGYDTLDQDTLEYLSSRGMLQVSTIVEHAIANQGGFEIISINECDGSDGCDIKMASVRIGSSLGSYRASVSNLKNKTGALRVICYERIFDKFYYFIIPNIEYNSATTLEIPFEIDGTPKRQHIGKKKFKNWWVFEVPDFDALCGPTTTALPTHMLFDFDNVVLENNLEEAERLL